MLVCQARKKFIYESIYLKSIFKMSLQLTENVHTEYKEPFFLKS